MNKLRKALYIAVMTVVVAAMGVLIVACNGKEADDTEYTLTFMNGNAVHATVTGVTGSEVSVADPTKLNFTFDGWSSTSDGKNIVELPATMPAQNITYYAVFSERFNIKLDAGIGSLSDSESTISVKAGVKLYDLISSIKPSVDGDARFAAWFYGSERLTDNSTSVMPSHSITLTAKYEVDYTLKIYKQSEYDVVGWDAPITENGVGFVGEHVENIPAYQGYVYNRAEEGDNNSLTEFLSSDREQNTFDVFYDVLGYAIEFNANLPDGVTPSGSMSQLTFGYNKDYDVPDCDFEANGYKFLGWSTVAEGDIEYRVGQKIKVTRTTMLYAVWAKGLRDVSGHSSDYIYIAENASGTVVAYLERMGIDEQVGRYDANTCEFVFEANDAVLLRGIAYRDAGAFVYLDNAETSAYVLNKRVGATDDQGFITLNNEIDSATVLELKTDGKAVYKNAEGNVNGTYEFDGEENSLKFVSETTNFYFRLIDRTIDGSVMSVFEMRGDVYGTWYHVDGNSIDAYYMEFDGYGGATLHALGYASQIRTSANLTTVSATGYYQEIENDPKANVRVTVFNTVNGNRYGRTTYVKLRTSEENYGSEQSPIHNVYTEKGIEQTFYALPDNADDENFDLETYKQTADTIVLDGYGIYADSAVFTCADGKTIKGTYVLDIYVSELYITPDGGDSIGFIIYSMTKDEVTTLFFRSISEEYDVRPILGLDTRLNLTYRFRIIDENQALFSFNLPVSDSFLGIYKYNLVMTTLFDGTYSEVGKDAEGKPLYEFIASSGLTQDLIDSLYVIYYYNYGGIGLDVSGFRRFKFGETTGQLSTGQQISCFNAVAVFDELENTQIIIDNVTYTLDGYGTAKSNDADISDKAYAVDASRRQLVVSWKDGENDSVSHSVSFVRVPDGEGFAYKRLIGEYVTENAGYLFIVSLLEDGYGMLGYFNQQSRSVVNVSIGRVSGDTIFTYTEIESLNSGITCPIDALYGDFGFSVVTEPNAQTRGTVRIYVGSTDSVTVDIAGGGSLTLNYAESKATYNDGNNTYEGEFVVYEDIAVVKYVTSAAGADPIVTETKSFRLTYGENSQTIISCKQVSSEAGTWWNLDDTNSYIELSGGDFTESEIVTGYEDGKPITEKVLTAPAVYHEFNAESKSYTVIQGKYYKTSNQSTREFIFLYDMQQGNETVAAQIRMQIGYNLGGFPLFQEYIQPLGAYVYTGTSSQYVGVLTGGGYNAQTFVINNTKYTGSLVFYTNGIMAFNVDNSDAVFYFTIVGERIILLDGTYRAPNFGNFSCIDGNELVLSDNTKVKSVRLTGYNVALLITGETVNEEGETILTYKTAMYLPLTSTTYMLYEIDSDGKLVGALAKFVLRYNNDGENADDYVIVFSDKKIDYIFNSSFVNGLESMTFDGFGNATYVDAKGIVRAAIYERIDGDVIRVTYVGNDTLEMVYIEIGDGVYEIIPDGDDRIPVTPDDGSEEQTALAA